MDFIVCPDCGASWHGIEDEECYWCNRRYLAKREGERKRLLFPEWLDWGERYWRLSEINKRVWENTRGYRGDFVKSWQREMQRAIIEGTITDGERAQALSRSVRWMTHLPKPAD